MRMRERERAFLQKGHLSSMARETGLEPFALCKTPETQILERSCELGTTQRCQCRNVSSGKSQRFHADARRNVGSDCCAGPIELGQ